MTFRCSVTLLVAVCWLALLSCSYLPLSAAQSSSSLAPVITSLSGCPVSPADNVTLLCSPPFTLTVTGTGLVQSDVVNISNYACIQINALADGSGVNCVASNPYFPLPYNTNLPVTVIDLSTHLTSNTVNSLQIVAQQPVVLSSISGCTGSGQVTNNCDLSSSIITVTGSGFVYDNERWYLLFGASTAGSLVTDFRTAGVYPFIGNTVVLPLNFTLSVWQGSTIPSSSLTGTMSICFTHGNTASNCLALSYFYAPPDTAPPTAAPIVGFVTNSSLTVLSVSGCPSVYSNGSTSGCNYPSAYTTLTIVGSSFPSASQLYVTVGTVRCIVPSIVRGTNSTTLQCYIPNEFTSVAFDQWLPVVVIDAIGLQQGVPASLIQFAAPVYPTITAVTGCPGDGVNGALSTNGCTLTSTVTLVGSGFVPDRLSWQMSVGVTGTTLSNPRTPITAYIVDSDTIEIPTSLLYTIIGTSITSQSTSISLYVLHSGTIVGPVQITIPTPPLSVSAVIGCGASSNANLTVVGCNPGVSVITVQGVSFSSVMTVTVAGQPCVLISYTSTSLQCTLPVVYGLQPNVGYDLFIGNFAGNITIPAAVSYTSYPTIVSVTSPFCPPDFAWSNSGPAPLYCSAYAQLTLVGVYFQDLSTLTVNITGASRTQQPLSCGNLTYQSASELTCTLPAVSTLFAQYKPHTVQIWENSTFASNAYQTVLYTDTIQQPNLVSVQGCVSVDAVTRVASGCQVGDVITLNGANFVANTINTQVQLWSDGDVFQCSVPRVLSRTQMTCVLPYLPLLAVDSVVPVRIGNMNGMQSNWLVAINFNVASTAASSSDTRFIISLAVLVPLVAVLLVALGVVVLKRTGSGKQDGVEQQQVGGRSQGWARHSDEKEESGLQMSGVDVDTFNNNEQ